MPEEKIPEEKHEEKHEEMQKGFKMKPVYAAAIVLAVIVIISVAYLVGASVPVVAAGDNVSVYYTGSYTNGTVFNSNVGLQPLQFIAGSNQLILGFSNGVIGMKLNQTKNITIPENEAYGPVDPSLIIDVPLSEFGNQSVSVGEYLSSNSGSRGVIEAVNSTYVKVNFNNPLAGKTLVFQIKVVSIHK